MSRHDAVKRHGFRSAMKSKENLSSMKGVRFDGIYNGKEAEVGHGGGCVHIYIYIGCLGMPSLTIRVCRLPNNCSSSIYLPIAITAGIPVAACIRLPLNSKHARTSITTELRCLPCSVRFQV